MHRHVGRAGLLVLAALFVVLTIEDVYIWVTAGTVPGLEFFLGLLLVVGTWFYAIRTAREHPPPRHGG